MAALKGSRNGFSNTACATCDQYLTGHVVDSFVFDF